MKVAICFSGALRSFDTCIYSTIRYLINSFDNPDIFLHMWDFKKENNDINYNFKWRDNTTDISKILKILKPKDFIIEKYDNNQEQKIIETSKIDINKLDDEKKRNYGFNCCSMYYKILKSFELAENYSINNDIKYDLYIRARLDFIWEDSIKIKEIKEKTIYLIKDRYATHSKLITNDKFFGGNYEVMKYMCNIFNKLKDYQTENILIEGQTINEYHIKKSNFNVEWLGDKNTYYKCMGRHDIDFKNIKYNLTHVINDINNNNIKIFINNVIYKLIHKGYIINNYHNYDNLEIISNYNKITELLFELKTNNYKEIKITEENDYYEIHIEYNNINIKINKKIIFEEIIADFISYIFSYNIKNKNCIIDAIYEIIDNNVLLVNDVILYKFMDKGYYECKIINIIDNQIIINHNKSNKKVNKHDIKIINYFNYLHDNILYY